MKFKCGMTEAEAKAKADSLRRWRRVFAWTPIQVDVADCRWLEFVEMSYPRATALFSEVYEGLPRYRAVKQ